MTAGELTGQMRSAAETLKKVGALYGYPNPAAAEFSAEFLEREADLLDSPIPGVEP